MKTTLFILTLLPFIGLSQDITWANYQGKPPAGEATVLARTVTNLKMTTMETEGKFYFEVKGGMNPFLSWTRTSSQKVLQHEKTHRLIAVIFGKLCQREIDSLGLQGQGASAGAIAQASFSKWYEKMATMQDEFDLETSHGTMPQMEAIWESLVADKLKELK